MRMLFSFIGWSIYVLPDPIRFSLAWGIGKFLKILKIRKKVVVDNLQLVFPKKSTVEKEKLMNDFYTHFGNVCLEFFFIFGPMKRYVQKYSEVRGVENFQKALAKGRGGFFLSSHIGNWEVMAATGVQLADIPIMLVTKKLKPQWFHDLIETAREKVGVFATYEPKTVKDIFRQLKNKKFVGFVLDQYAGAPVGVRVPFLGVTVGTTNALATLIKRTGAPILPAVCYRTLEGRWILELRPEIEWISNENAHKELALNTARYASLIEKDVLDHPEQWLWSHRRFKGDLSPLHPTEWDSPRVRF